MTFDGIIKEEGKSYQDARETFQWHPVTTPPLPPESPLSSSVSRLTELLGPILPRFDLESRDDQAKLLLLAEALLPDVPIEEALAEILAEEQTRRESTRLPKGKTVWDLLRAKPVRKYLIQDFLAECSPTIVHGGVKCAKTLLSQYIALLLVAPESMGLKAFDRFDVIRSAPVLFMSAESSEQHLASRFAAIAEALQIDPRWADSIELLSRVDDFTTATGRKNFSKRLRSIRGGLVVVDTISHALPGLELSQQNLVSPILAEVRDICAEHAVSSLFIHHNRQSKRNESRGWPSLQDMQWPSLQAWAREWISLSKRDTSRFDGMFRLKMVSAGNSGHNSAWNLDIVEMLGATYTWQTCLSPAPENKSQTTEARLNTQPANGTREDKVTYYSRRIKEELSLVSHPISKSQLTKLTGISNHNITGALKYMEIRKEVVTELITSRNQKCIGYRISNRPDSSSPTT